jgi:hypothetical protein
MGGEEIAIALARRQRVAREGAIDRIVIAAGRGAQVGDDGIVVGGGHAWSSSIPRISCTLRMMLPVV